MKTIKGKIIVCVLSCCIALIGILSSSTVFISSRLTYKQSMEKLNEAASRYTSEISKWYSKQGAIIEMIAEVAEYGLKEDHEKKSYTTSILNENPQFVDVYVAYEDGKFISGTDI